MPTEFRPSYEPPVPVSRSFPYLPPLLLVLAVIAWIFGHHKISLNLIYMAFWLWLLRRTARRPQPARIQLSEQGVLVLGAPLGSTDYTPLQTLAWADVASLNYRYADLFGWPTSPTGYIEAWLHDGQHIRLTGPGGKQQSGWVAVEEGGADFVSSLKQYSGKAIQPAVLPERRTYPANSLHALGLSFVAMIAGLIIGAQAETAFISPRWPLLLALTAALLMIWPLLHWQRRITRRDTVWLASTFSAGFLTLAGYFALMALPSTLGQPQTVTFQIAAQDHWLYLRSTSPALQYRLLARQGQTASKPPATYSGTVYTLPLGFSGVPRRQWLGRDELAVD